MCRVWGSGVCVHRAWSGGVFGRVKGSTGKTVLFTIRKPVASN